MQVTKQTIRRAIIVATTMTKGLKGSEITGYMVDGWFAKATSHQMTDEGFLAAFDKATDASTFFPSWHEVLAEYDTSHLILDPVKTGEHMGVPEIGSREVCDQKGLPYVELREETPSALPSPELREAARERLENALENFPVKRIEPARERTPFDHSPDPDAQAKRERSLAELREGV